MRFFTIILLLLFTGIATDIFGQNTDNNNQKSSFNFAGSQYATRMSNIEQNKLKETKDFDALIEWCSEELPKHFKPTLNVTATKGEKEGYFTLIFEIIYKSSNGKDTNFARQFINKLESIAMTEKEIEEYEALREMPTAIGAFYPTREHSGFGKGFHFCFRNQADDIYKMTTKLNECFYNALFKYSIKDNLGEISEIKEIGPNEYSSRFSGTGLLEDATIEYKYKYEYDEYGRQYVDSICDNYSMPGFGCYENNCIIPSYNLAYYTSSKIFSTIQYILRLKTQIHSSDIGKYNNFVLIKNIAADESIKNNQARTKNDSKKNTMNAAHYHMKGYMTDNEGDHPIELDFDLKGKTLTNVIYKNSTLGGKIMMKCTNYIGDNDNIDSFTLAGKDGPKDFIMKLRSDVNDGGLYFGNARVGSKQLTVTLYLE